MIMMESLKKHRRLIGAMLFLIFCFSVYGLYAKVRDNFDSILKSSLQKYVGVKVDYSDINFKEKGLIEVSDFIMNGEVDPAREKLEPIVSSDKLFIEYSFWGLLNGKIIKEISAENPLIYVTLDKNWKVNFVKLFSKEQSGLRVKKQKKSSDGINVPIGLISVKDARLVYQDFHFERPIRKDLTDVNGYVSFEDSGISLKFSGNDNGGVYEYSFEKKDEYSMNVKLKNVEIDDVLMQYSFSSKYVEYSEGRADIDIDISPGDYTGYANLRNGVARYKGLEDEFHSVNAEILLDGRNIEISSTMKIEDKQLEFSLDKKNKKYVLGLKSKDLNYKELLKYKLIRDIGLNYDGDAYIENIDAKFYIENGEISIGTYFELEDLQLGDFYLSKINGNLRYAEKVFALEKLKFNFQHDKFKEAFSGAEMELDAVVKDGKWDIEYRAGELKSRSNIGNISGNIKYDMDSKEADFTVNSAIIDLLGNLDFKEKELQVKSKKIEAFNVFYRGKYQIDGELEVVYNYGNAELKKAFGDLVVQNKYFDQLVLKFSANDNVLLLNEFSAKKDGCNIEATGIAKLDDWTYKVNFDKLEFDIGKLVETEVEGEFTSKALLKGKGDKLEAYVDAQSEAGKYYLKYENLQTKMFIKYDKKLKVYGDTHIGSLGYNGEKIYDLLVKTSFENNELHFKEISNNLLTMAGYYNIIERNIDLKYGVKNFYLEKIHALKGKGFEGVASDIQGDLSGDISNPILTADVKDLKLKYKEFEEVQIDGQLDYQNGVINFNELYLDKNMLNGQLNFKKSEFDLKLNIFENKVPAYYNDKNFRYRVIGELNTWGNFKNIKAASDLILDKVYYRGRQVPDVKIKLTYNGGNLDKLLMSGVLNFQEISLLDKNTESLLSAQGYINFEDENLKMSVENEKLDFSKLSHLFQSEIAQGKLGINVELEGKFKELDYKAEFKSEDLKISGFDIENIDADIVGDSNKFHINRMNIDYEGNNLNLTGGMVYEPFEYEFKVKSEEIDLNFLNIFLYQKQVSDLQGMANMDMYLSNHGKREGKFSVDNLSFNLENRGLYFKDISTDVVLDSEQIQISKFDGIVNSGKIDLDGYLKLPEISLKNLEEKEIELKDYYLNLKLDNVSYQYLKVIKLFLSSDLKLRKNAITGDIVVQKGEILGIPVFKSKETKEPQKESKLGFLKEFFKKDVFNFRRDSETGLTMLEVEKEDQNGFKADVDFKIADPIKLRIDKMTLIEDFEANIEGGGKLKYRDNKFNFLGRLSTEDGVITFNKNLFEIQSGLVVFSDATDYFPDVNPTISVVARSEIANEDVYVNINGEYDNLDLQLSSSSGLSQEDIGSLLLFHNTLDESSSNAVVKDILDKQISDQIFTPISSELERIFGIEKIKISSDIVAYQYQEGQYVDAESLRLGAAIELQNPLYKDVINWNAKASLSDTQNTDTIDTYDLWLDYKIKENISWGIGAQKLSSDLSGEREDQLNYHIDLNFKKRLDSIFDIFKFK